MRTVNGRTILILALACLFVTVFVVFSVSQEVENTNVVKADSEPAMEERGKDDLTWPMWQHDERHTAYTSGTGTIATPTLNWIFYGGTWQGPAIGDVDDDGQMEVVIAKGYDFYCLDGSSGDFEWVFETGPHEYYDFDGKVAAICDVDEDGQTEVILGSEYNPNYGKVFCLRGSDGGLKWDYPACGGTTSPIVFDVDLDGMLEVILGDFQGYVYCLDPNGNEEWTQLLPSEIRPLYTPAAADVDNDGKIEIIILANTNDLYCLDGRNGGVEWTRDEPPDVWGPPILSNVDADANLEILVETFWGTLCVDGFDGSEEWHFERGTLGQGPAIADIDNDGIIEVVFKGWYSDTLYCLNAASGTIEWYYELAGPEGTYGESGCAICDIDGDLDLEIIAGSRSDTLYCFDGHGNLEWVYEMDGQARWLSIGDADNDGYVDILVSVRHLVALAGTTTTHCLGLGPTNEPPTAEILSINPDYVEEGQPVSFTGQGIDVDGTIEAYEWYSSRDQLIGTESEFTRSDLSVGVHTISLRVLDDGGAWSEKDFAALEVYSQYDKWALLAAILQLENAVVEKIDTMTAVLATAEAWAFKGIWMHDKDAVRETQKVLTVEGYVENFLEWLWRGKPTPGGIANLGASMMVQSTLENMWNSEVNGRWERATNSIFNELGLDPTNDVWPCLRPPIENALLTHQEGPYINNRKQIIGSKLDLTNYIMSHDLPDEVHFYNLLNSIRELTSDVKESHSRGENELFKWYSPTAHVDPPHDAEVYLMMNLGDWKDEVDESQYVETMDSLWERAENDRQTRTEGYIIALTSGAGLTFFIKAALIFFGGPVGWLAEAFMALSIFGWIELPTSAAYNYLEIESAKSIAVENIQVMSAFSRDLDALDRIVEDMATYVKTAMNGSSDLPWSAARLEYLDIPDNIEIPPGAQMAEDIQGYVTVKNIGPQTAKVNLYLDITTEGGPHAGECLSVTGPEGITLLDPDQVAVIPFEFSVPGPEMLGSYRKYKAWPHITIGTNRDCDRYAGITTDQYFTISVTGQKSVLGRDQTVSLVMMDSVLQEQTRSAQYTPTYYQTSFLLDYDDGDLDLHVYDNAGNHTGVNYLTGEVEIGIPNSSYNGPTSLPEIITIDMSAGHQCTVKVTGVSTDGYNTFYVSAVETAERPATLDIPPVNVLFVGAQADTTVASIPVAEIGGHHDATGIQATAADLVGDSYTIQSSSVFFDSTIPDIPAGSSINPSIYVSVPSDAPPGEYTGDIHITSDNAGDDQVTVTLWVENPPAQPSTPSGFTLGYCDSTYSYWTTTTDPENDSVYYKFDWGDETYCEWYGPFGSGQACTTSHAWNESGIYRVKTRAEDTWGQRTGWSDPLEVAIGAEWHGLQAYWSFDEGNGDIAHDGTGRDRDGTIYGAIWTDGISGSALYFDGDEDHVSVPPLLTSDSSGTISLWFSATDEITTSSNAYLLAIKDSDDIPRRYIILGDVTSVIQEEIFGVLGDQAGGNPRSAVSSDQLSSINPGWHHFVMLSGVSGHSYYLDNCELVPDLFYGGWGPSTNLLPISGATEAWIGHKTSKSAELENELTIDEIRIYNRVLSEVEIEWLYLDPLRGDANRDGIVDIADVVYLINYLFLDGTPPDPLGAGDANGDSVVDVGDVLYLINYLFIGGSPPVRLVPE